MIKKSLKRLFSAKTMRAIVFDQPGGPEVMKIGTVPLPECKPTEALLKIEATTVNRADTLQRQGKYPPPKGASSIIGLEAIGHLVDPVTLQKIDDNRYLALLPGGGYA